VEYRIEYDPVADALYIKIKDDKVAYSTEANDNIIVDFNEKGEVVGLEILHFSKSKVNLNELVIKGIEVAVKIA